MASPTELDLFKRSLGGDRRARTELYKKYIYSSARIRDLAQGYSSVNDFLHDCLNNFLRTEHSFHTEDDLTPWVESVAVWTALISERQKDMHTRGAQGEIRMCAEIEGEDAVQGQLLASYSPPRNGDEDAPLARILELLNEAERAVFQKRAVENATWEETAGACDKALHLTGPVFAKAAAKLVRLFGAPPPSDDDLVPVVSRAFAKPSKPEGRAISLQMDNAFYNLTPEMQAIGLTTVPEARAIVLWDAARQTMPPADELRKHVSRCRYCAAMLRSMILMQNAIFSPPGSAFRLCPGAFALSTAPDMVHAAFDEHLALCPICRDERTQVLEGNVPRTQSSGYSPKAKKQGRKFVWAMAAVALLGAASLAGYLYVRSGSPSYQAVAEKTVPTVSIDTRYRDLVKDVPFDDQQVLASVLPANRPAIKAAMDQLSLGDAGQALSISEEVASKGNDPGAQMIYAMSLFRTRLLTDAYREMLKSEAMSPRGPMRCWVMLQFALTVGDRKVVEREAQHLADDPVYGERAQELLVHVRARG